MASDRDTSAEGGGGGSRPRLAVIANAPSPYRIAQHRRIVNELPEVELFSVFKHEHNRSPWSNPLPPEINPVVFGHGENMVEKNRGLNALKQFRRGGEINRWLRENRIDAVILCGYNDLGLLRIMRDCSRRGVKLFMFSDSNVYGDHATGAARVIKNRLVPRVLARLDGLMACSTRCIEFFQRYGFSGTPAFFMPHEPDYELMRSIGPEQVEEARRRHGLRDDLKYINFCARMAEVKRPDLLVDAFARIADDRPEWGVVFVGGGDLLERVRVAIPPALRDRVVLTGFVDGPENVGALYKCCEIHCLPSKHEPWAAVVPEAASAGLAIVCSHVVGAAAECVEDGVNGYVFESGNAGDLAEKLMLATDPDRLPGLKRGTLEVSARWRRRGDPVDGVRRALEFVGLLSPRSGRRPTGDPYEDWKADIEAGVNAVGAAGAAGVASSVP